MSDSGHLRKYDACWPNDCFLIRKRTLGEAPANDRFWPIPAVPIQSSRMTESGQRGDYLRSHRRRLLSDGQQSSGVRFQINIESRCSAVQTSKTTLAGRVRKGYFESHPNFCRPVTFIWARVQLIAPIFLATFRMSRSP